MVQRNPGGAAAVWLWLALAAVVVVLDPKQGDSPYNPKMALQGGGGGTGPF